MLFKNNLKNYKPASLYNELKLPVFNHSDNTSVISSKSSFISIIYSMVLRCTASNTSFVVHFFDVDFDFFETDVTLPVGVDGAFLSIVIIDSSRLSPAIDTAGVTMIF